MGMLVLTIVMIALYYFVRRDPSAEPIKTVPVVYLVLTLCLVAVLTLGGFNPLEWPTHVGVPLPHELVTYSADSCSQFERDTMGGTLISLALLPLGTAAMFIGAVTAIAGVIAFAIALVAVFVGSVVSFIHQSSVPLMLALRFLMWSAITLLAAIGMELFVHWVFDTQMC